MNKRLRLLTSLTALFFALGGSHAAWGLGLGEIKAESALNEPLVAKIELLNASTLSNRDIIVDIGSKEDYRVAGVERDFFHTDLTLEPYIDGQGKPYISVTSTKPVIEPFVNFVVQIRWPQGKLLREYTILLDLPVFTGRTQQKAPEAPTAASRDSSRQSTPVRQPRVSAPEKKIAPKPVVNAGGEYLVRNGDTLWSLAGGIAAETGSTRQQVMLAIRDGNPNAFMNGDPNALKAGVVLRMPDQGDTGRRTASDAATEFANLQKRAGRAIEATPVRSSSNNFREQSTAQAPRAGRLALTSSAALGSGESAGAQSAESDDELANSLTTANEVLKEELDRVEVENQDLRERVAALEELVEEQQEVVELLSVESNELASVQEGLQAASEASSQESSLTEEVAVQVEEIADETPEAAADTPAEAAVAQTELQAEVVQPEPTPQPSLLDSIMGFLPYIGALIVVVLLAVMLLLKRRKAPEQEDDLLVDDIESELDDELADDDLDEPVVGAPADTDDFTDEAEDDDDFEGGLESMDELFADDGEEAEQSPEDVSSEESDAESDEIESSDEVEEEIGDVDEGDVEDIDLESALEDLDEFADLDSFFDEGDIEDFDPDSAEGLDDAGDDMPAAEEAMPEESGDLDEVETEAAAEEELDIDLPGEPAEQDQAETEDTSATIDSSATIIDSSATMDFESFELPEEDASDNAPEDLHDEEHSMDFDDEIELPSLDEDPLEAAPQEEDSANSMDFDLDDFDPIGGAETAEDETPAEPAGNEMEFDSESIELPAEVEDEPAEDLHDEEHSMDFDDDIELPELDEETSGADSEEESENSMEFDVGDLELPTDETSSDDDLSGLDLDLGDSDDSEEDVSDLTGGLEEDMDDLLADFDAEESGEQEVADDEFDLPDLGGSDGDDSDDLGEADLSADLDDGLGLDAGDLDLDEGLDLDDDLLADFGDDDSGDLEEEMNTKLELAEAYVEMVDIRGARELINEILADGNDTQKAAAEKLAERIEGLG